MYLKKIFSKFEVKSLLLAILILYLFPVISSGQQSRKSERLFIKTFEVYQGVSTSLAESIRDKMVLYFFQESGDKYRVLSESDIKTMYKQAEILIHAGCNKQECLEQIIYAIDADMIIYGKLKKKEGKIKAYVQSLVRNRETDELSKGLVMEFSFYLTQMEWYVMEIVKKIINPNYSIDPSKAPTETEIKAEMQELKYEGLKGIDISAMKFKTDDTAINMILDYSKPLIKEGDDLFRVKNYETAIEKYRKIIEKMETKLPASTQEELSKFKTSIEDRIVSSYVMQFKTKIEDTDKIAKNSKYEEALREYKNINDEFNTINNRYKKQLDYINEVLLRRLDSVYLLWSRHTEKEADRLYSEYKFSDAISKYEESLLYLEKTYFKNEPSFKSYKQNLENKEDLVNTTGFSYYKNKMKSYYDWVDFFNFSDQEARAKEILNNAKKYIHDSRWCDNFEILKKYNERAKLLNEPEMSKDNCPGVSGAIASFDSVKETNIAGIDFIYVPPGNFMMGSADNASQDEKPRHKVQVSGFWMSKYEITQEQYEDLTGENPSCFRSRNNPVEQVSWYSAKQFCKKLNAKYNITARLPTEAEWEYACKSGTTNVFYWGDSIDGNYCWYDDNSDKSTHSVGSKKPNKLGLYDMTGNVWEWCEDRYDKDYYSNSPSKDPTGPESGSDRVLRGGSWNNSYKKIYSAARFWFDPDSFWNSFGFRIVLIK